MKYTGVVDINPLALAVVLIISSVACHPTNKPGSGNATAPIDIEYVASGNCDQTLRSFKYQVSGTATQSGSFGGSVGLPAPINSQQGCGWSQVTSNLNAGTYNLAVQVQDSTGWSTVVSNCAVTLTSGGGARRVNIDNTSHSCVVGDENNVTYP